MTGKLSSDELAAPDVELLNPRTPGKVYDVLRAVHIREWLDERGQWHVTIPAYRLPELEEAYRVATAQEGGK